MQAEEVGMFVSSLRFPPLVGIALAWSFVMAAPARADDVDDAAALLSRYAAGTVPIDDQVAIALHTLAAHGERAELSLLRSLVDHEQPLIAEAAAGAIHDIRERARDTQRETFAARLPAAGEIVSVAAAFRTEGLGAEAALCAAYASEVLVRAAETSAAHPVDPLPQDGDADALLESGDARKALAASLFHRPSGARLRDADLAALRSEAVAREEIGDLDGALHLYARLVAYGDPAAQDALDGFGIDAERLLLGLYVHPKDGTLQGADGPIVINHLVRNGETLTVAVLAERHQTGTVSERMTTVDALGRMLEDQSRARPLPSAGRRIAREALAEVARTGLDPLAALAGEVLPR
jgi:hypothetical protein